MSVRMALAKLSAAAAGGALLGGGALHVAEPPATNAPSYKSVKGPASASPKYIKQRPAKRVAEKPRKVKRARRVIEEEECCTPQMAMVPLPQQGS